jgi:hypothetical protein
MGGLELLLRQTSSTDYERVECTADHLDRWILTANRKFVAPSVHQVQRLTNLLRVVQSRHSRRDWRPLIAAWRLLCESGSGKRRSADQRMRGLAAY